MARFKLPKLDPLPVPPADWFGLSGQFAALAGDAAQPLAQGDHLASTFVGDSARFLNSSQADFETTHATMNEGGTVLQNLSDDAERVDFTAELVYFKQLEGVAGAGANDAAGLGGSANPAMGAPSPPVTPQPTPGPIGGRGGTGLAPPGGRDCEPGYFYDEYSGQCARAADLIVKGYHRDPITGRWVPPLVKPTTPVARPIF